MKNTGLKIAGLLVTIAGCGLTILTNIIDDKKLDAEIDERIEIALAERREQDND